jgi:hypothetical protein
MVFIIVWIGLSLLVGMAGKDKKIGFGATFAISLILSPLIALIVAMVSKPASSVRIICDGCQREIKDKYDKVTTDSGMSFDYCSLFCKDSDRSRRVSASGQAPD